MPFITVAGGQIYHQTGGQGDPPLVFVHGSCCNHGFFAPQASFFRRRRRVTVLDLLGHGRSDKPERRYHVGAFARDLIEFCRQMGLTRVVLVGHSLGGAIAVEIAARDPELVAAVVALDSSLLPPRVGSVFPAPPLLKKIKGPDQTRFLRSRFEHFFLPGDDSERKASILDQISQTPSHVVASLFENAGTWDGAQAARALKAPLLFLSATRHRTNPRRLSALCPGMVFGQVVGSGHFLQLEVPDQVNAMIDRFLNLPWDPNPVHDPESVGDSDFF